MIDKRSLKQEFKLRIYRYVIRLLKFLVRLPNDPVTREIKGQLTRSGTSMGANYREANETETKKDFNFRIRICRKEGKETFYWLQLLNDANPNFKNPINNQAGKQERMAFAKRISTIVVMVDELTGDGAGAPFIHSIAKWLDNQFIRPFEDIISLGTHRGFDNVH